MDRDWLFTWTCYGSWLPGAAKGFVGNVRDKDGEHVSHNIPGMPFDANMPRLEAYVREHMSGPTVVLENADANAMIAQYQETAKIRRWTLQAASVMYNHTHIVLSAPGDPDPSLIMETLKSWATRSLRKHRSVPLNGTFWTANGLKRKLPDDEAVLGAVIYVVKKQPNPLAVYYSLNWQDALDSFIDD